MRRTIAGLALAGSLLIAGPAHACPSRWLSARDGWRPVPHAIRAQLIADGERVGRHARIRYGDTTVVDLDGRRGGRKISS